MVRKYLVGVVQLDTQNDKGKNLERICAYIDEAADRGAKLVALPEVMNLIGEKNVGEGGEAEPIPGYTTQILAKKARERRVYLHCGSMKEAIPGEARAYNTTVMLDDKGEIIAKYRKLHTFDVTLADGTVCNESARVRPGSEIVTVDTELGRLGFSICYDIRFPELFRLLAAAGARLVFTPANFTLPTGKDHWEPILRARAIENACYVVAPAQIGKKPNFTAFGNSMVVDPWGSVVARAKDEPGVAIAEIDLDYQDKVRAQLPAFQNRRADVYDLRVKQ
ncbi:MAG TPA: carbon-nitrogen hydrolase family protein [Spirochaetales bacterium]|nr:carbon-nitrogen hydrolase family protein [Spirochaetales bacterium]HRY55059.1 carbon-nitrogen hydrolase family protein [Spirochaetia bacterium]HRZ64226.1 carbon-nitrogen hydrolase family protein [Spirochaetia bacterium]